MKRAIVLGAGGFIGSHLVSKLKRDGYWVRGVDLKRPEYSTTDADQFLIADLRDEKTCEEILQVHGRIIHEVYQLGADMGGAGYTFTGKYDFDIISNSCKININVSNAIRKLNNVNKVFFSSSACVYSTNCKEEMAYPAMPDSEYGWEKLFSERIWKALSKDTGIPVRIARFHNVFGEYETWHGGKEKFPCAVCRKVSEVDDGGTIEIWGDGKQTRSFLYIDECLIGIEKLMKSEYNEPINIGSDESYTINDVVQMVAEIANKTIKISHIPGPQGVRHRNSDNTLIKEVLDWEPSMTLKEGMTKTFSWVNKQVHNT